MANHTDLIQKEFERLSEKYKVAVPEWSVIPGSVSYFDHQDQKIRLAEDVIEDGNPDLIKYLVAHEFRHWYQYHEGNLQGFSSLREIDAHRNAMDEITGRKRIFPIFADRPTPFLDSLLNDMDKSLFPVQDTCATCKNWLKKRKSEKDGEK